MLSFLNIGILLGLLGVSIPFIIHLFAKRNQKKVYFSTLRFLKILQPRQLRRIQLKQSLLVYLEDITRNAGDLKKPIGYLRKV